MQELRNNDVYGHIVKPVHASELHHGLGESDGGVHNGAFQNHKVNVPCQAKQTAHRLFPDGGITA
jgi:hypothetical protein